MFNLWNVVQTEANTCVFDVTRANMPRLGTGSTDWAEAALVALGASARVARTGVRAARGFYFSSYPGHAEWRDRWPDCWLVEVQANTPFALVAQEEPVIVDELDDSWDGETSDPRHDNTAILIGDVVDGPAREILASIDSEVCKRLPDTSRTLSLRTFADATQVRLLVASADLPPAVAALERSLMTAAASGARVNWQGAAPEPG